MYVACTRAKDRLYLSDSEGFNVQNSLAKFPSRFIREAADECGPLYDVEGPVGPELWRGTGRLIAGLDAPAPPSAPLFAAGARVKHTVFGPGTVLESDPDAGTVRVRFDSFGVRRLAAGVLEECPENS